MNPPFQLSIVIAIAVIALAAAIYGASRSSSGLRPSVRAVLIGLRILAVAAVCMLLLNPGKWVLPDGAKKRPWLILADNSASMARPDGKSTRFAVASDLAKQAADRAEKSEIPLHVHPFSAGLSAKTKIDQMMPPVAEGTAILPSLTTALQMAASTGDSLAGVIVLSDGRETSPGSAQALEDFTLRARSRSIAVHTVAIGADAPAPDLALVQHRSTLTTFPGQTLRIPVVLESKELDPARATVTLRDESGKEISSVTLEVPSGGIATGVIETTAPAASTRWQLDTPVLPDEVRSGNNRTKLDLRVLTSKTRVFIAEGAPYWDSKFLAQLLRQQPHMDVHSVHRLSDTRYFRINSGEADPSETNHPVFPADLAELSRYDLIVLGKNVDPFLTPERTEALRSFVRDHGAAILFSRGKPTTGEVPALEPLEPVSWSRETAADFRFTPTREGETAGLFGQALPAPDASLWKSLPTLKDGRLVSQVKPFTRVLADGRSDTGTASGNFPALLVRRYGQGVVGLVNGDGLWRWDFFPEARELGNHYEDFWTQLIQWMASYSEFLPGQDFSLRLPATRGSAGTSLAATLSYRGSEPVPQPKVRIASPSGTVSEIQPAAFPDPSGRPLWRASFTPDAPGDWKLSVIDPREKAPPAPEIIFTVPHPNSENDDLSADPQYLASLSAATSGEAIKPDAFSDFLDRHLQAEPPVTPQAGAVWKPLWNNACTALLIATLLAAEWFFRRRQGLS